MKKLNLLCALIAFSLGAASQSKYPAPAFAMGNFTDDYGIKYTINDTIWVQHPSTKYHIIKWNQDKQYLVAKNDGANPSDKNKYTRIDYMTFNGMAPFLWGFCLTVYDAENDKLAEDTAQADRLNPKKGCNGYPFSRMKKIESKPDTN